MRWGLILGGVVALSAIIYIVVKRWKSIKETYQTRSFYEVIKTACGEIAVLLFVFPLIDMLGKDDNKGHEHWKLVVASAIIGFVFIGIAGRYAKKYQDAEDAEEARKRAGHP